VPADAVVLVEGVYSSSKLLREYFEFTIWVDCPYHVRLARGIGRDGGSMRAMWADHWMPLEDRYVGDEHPDARADLVIDGASAGADRVVFSLAPPRPRGLAFPVGLEDGEIRLEPWSEKDLPALQEASTDESITRITAVPSPYSPQAGDAFLRDRREAARHGSALSLAIQENKTAATLGGVNLNSFDWQRRCARVGYWVLPSARGRGAATGALRLISDWALSDLGLRRLEMHIEPSNVASIKVAEGAGYRVAGTVREKPFGKGLELDMLRYARARASRLFM
jgi:RimJ/RimL family protein N-acetyltransferase